MGLALFLFVGFVFLLLVRTIIRRAKFMRRCEMVPGPPAQIPLFGSITDVSVKPEALLLHISNLSNVWRNKGNNNGSMFRVWIGPFPVFLLVTADSVESILSSNKTIDKSREYNFLQEWLGTGLLTSTGSKWHSRRKMLTPAFHFRILEEFLNVFNEQSRVLVEMLNEKAHDGRAFDIYPYTTNCTLDIICETAMGRNINAQRDSESSYIRALYKMSHIVQARQTRPWLQPDLLFYWFPYGDEQTKCLSILHGFTDKVIKERKAKYAQLKNQQQTEMSHSADNSRAGDEDEEFMKKKTRLAFLDLLIEASENGSMLSDLDIREEVDTFMFEGHDTTTAAINWSLFLIGRNPKVQEQVHDELKQVFGDSDRPVTMSDLSQLKYLECCIKEALRLYPSVPILARQLLQDTEISGYNAPVGATVMIITYLLHRDPYYFPDPESFKPERFFPENSRGRHPYAYVPFSAGPRNCIGQKFAMMEEKVILASIFRQFNVKAMDKPEDLTLLSELILRPRDGIRLSLSPRSVVA